MTWIFCSYKCYSQLFLGYGIYGVNLWCLETAMGILRLSLVQTLNPLTSYIGGFCIQSGEDHWEEKWRYPIRWVWMVYTGTDEEWTQVDHDTYLTFSGRNSNCFWYFNLYICVCLKIGVPRIQCPKAIFCIKIWKLGALLFWDIPIYIYINTYIHIYILILCFNFVCGISLCLCRAWFVSTCFAISKVLHQRCCGLLQGSWFGQEARAARLLPTITFLNAIHIDANGINKYTHHYCM